MILLLAGLGGDIGQYELLLILLLLAVGEFVLIHRLRRRERAGVTQ